MGHTLISGTQLQKLYKINDAIIIFMLEKKLKKISKKIRELRTDISNLK